MNNDATLQAMQIRHRDGNAAKLAIAYYLQATAAFMCNYACIGAGCKGGGVSAAEAPIGVEWPRCYHAT